MGKFLFPDEYYDSTYSINFKKYYNLGYRAVLFDIDNTLVPHDFPSDERAVSLIRRMKKVKSLRKSIIIRGLSHMICKGFNCAAECNKP